MRAVVQRVTACRVSVAGEVVGEIGLGMLVLLGVAEGDSEEDMRLLVDKISGLRIFSDGAGKMNLSLVDVSGAMLVVSQFTLLGDCRKGRRPSFTGAASPTLARPHYERFCEAVRARGIAVATGIFAADMQVSLVNDGPVTLVLDSVALR